MTEYILYGLLFIIMYLIIRHLFSFIKEGFETLQFSNTEKWGSYELSVKKNISKEGNEIAEELPNKPYPSNKSIQTKRELKNILELQKNIDEDIIRNIKEELYLENIIERFKITNRDSNKLINIIVHYIDPIIMKLKEKYNRVRPYKLEKKIKMYIDPPKHPSYPSGHSTQVYFIAYVLSFKYPNNKNKYLEIASKIAKNREYAGVHFFSDTEFGKEIAKILSEKFKIRFMNK